MRENEGIKIHIIVRLIQGQDERILILPYSIY